LGIRFTLTPLALECLVVHVVIFMQRSFICDSHRLQLGVCRRWTRARFAQASRVWVWVVEDNGMLDADVDERVSFLIHNSRIDLFQRVETLDDLAKNGSLAVKEVCVFAEGYDEL
jgi:hypothetical protein